MLRELEAAALLPRPARAPATLGARGRDAEDPPRDPHATRRVRRASSWRGIEIRTGTTPAEATGDERVWSLGDCAAVPNVKTPGRVDPPTCQHALRQARRLARNLASPRPEPYGYRMLGQVATLGRFKGIADVMGLRLRGFPGWFFARTYHLYQLPLLTRKLRVVADWTTALPFPRDVAELSMLGHPRRLADGRRP